MAQNYIQSSMKIICYIPCHQLIHHVVQGEGKVEALYSIVCGLLTDDMQIHSPMKVHSRLELIC